MMMVVGVRICVFQNLEHLEVFLVHTVKIQIPLRKHLIFLRILIMLLSNSCFMKLTYGRRKIKPSCWWETQLLTWVHFPLMRSLKTMSTVER
jgi:hypothetical protein